jgi:phospholipid/cholesterol/gamma-HCH transport system ATP-binding protein
MNPPVVELKDVHFDFGEKRVLDGVSLAATPEERLVIIGQSGAGKTTLLRLILGLLAPASGSVWLEGREISSLVDEDLRQVRQNIGMVFEEAALLSSLTIGENLALPLRELTTKTEEEIRAVVAAKLAIVGLSGEGRRMPFELSGGMRKRAGLARALVTQPRLVLFDEPTAGLDPVTSAVIEKLIINLTERTCVTSIITTPVVRTALRLATRVVMLHGGKIINVGSPAELLNSDHPVVKEFVSAAASSSRMARAA